ncbi:hypothetical protein EDB80DRAFT_689506 [Ilyonectria destructans]|nr:hypothetical protein EDB80DRAFT_689506 [Ilyonectria destructans]
MSLVDVNTPFRPRVVNEKPASWATPYNIHFDVDESQGDLHVGDLTKESAERVSDLLILNHVKFHTMFSEAGLHNHIVHHLCTLWALGASPPQIQAGYDHNKSYQLPHYNHPASAAMKLRDPALYKEKLGKSEHYIDYLRYFQDQISDKGTEEVLKQALFKGHAEADDLLARTFSDLQHPLLHLGFGLEFKQPCLVAEALAGAATHDNSPMGIFTPIEKHIASQSNLPSTSMMSVINALKADTEISNAIKPDDPFDRIRAVLIPRLGVKIASYLAKWRVEPTEADIAHRTAEMIHVSTYVLGAAQHPGKQPRLDFVYLHNTNLGFFYSTFMKLEWLSLKQKARLLEWKGWTDLATYVVNGCPTLYPERIKNYTPQQPGPWSSLIPRAIVHLDDGHVAKTVRAVLNAKNVSATSPSYQGTPDFPLTEDDMLNMAHLVLDSVEGSLSPELELPGKVVKVYGEFLGLGEDVLKLVARFVMWNGVEGSWVDVPNLKEGAKS